MPCFMRIIDKGVVPAKIFSIFFKSGVKIMFPHDRVILYPAGSCAAARFSRLTEAPGCGIMRASNMKGARYGSNLSRAHARLP